jgi:NAD(P)-dependent dehydrogenase (short-subunit alcohol dehydrogenase family)
VKNMNVKQIPNVLITGPAGNLGKAVTKRFLTEGANLILIDNRKDRLTNTYPELAQASNHLLLPGIDLIEIEGVENGIKQALDKMGRIDVLVHTAGGFQMGERVHEISSQSWDYLLDINLSTTLNITRAVVPSMVEQGKGKIITIGARPSLSGKARMGAYSVAKAGVLRLTESLSAEVKKSGINVNCVIPGTIDTPQNREAMPKADRSKWVSPESIADVIYFLASKEAKDIHGAAIPVYGA